MGINLCKGLNRFRFDFQNYDINEFDKLEIDYNILKKELDDLKSINYELQKQNDAMIELYDKMDIPNKVQFKKTNYDVEKALFKDPNTDDYVHV